MPKDRQGIAEKAHMKRGLNHNASTKRRKIPPKGAPASKKIKASERTYIPIPHLEDGSDTDDNNLDEDDVTFFTSNNAGSFLETLDARAISRTKKEQHRLHKLQKPVRVKRQYDDLPPVEDHESDPDNWSSDIEQNISDHGENDAPSRSDHDDGTTGDESQQEQVYEKLPRVRRPSWDTEQKVGPARLPIKLPDGTLKHRGHLPARVASSSGSEGDASEIEEDWAKDDPRKRAGVEDIATGARFGRPAVVDVISNKSRKSRIQSAKEQLAGICQEVVADPENGLGLLRRLHTFSLATITTPSHPDPVPNDPIIRKLALLSQLAVFNDIIPGYRIRPLTDHEKAEKVSQMVARTREYEQGLVAVYQNYLQTLEKELKAKSELADTALQCMCTLLTEATHFNFRANVMSAVVGRLSRRSWDSNSELCLNSLITVFRNDRTGAASLEIMRLMNRMIKERHFRVHPNTLSCLLHLRLRNELSGVRASGDKVSLEDGDSGKTPFDKHGRGKRRGKEGSAPYLSKKARKVLKEKKEIEKEMQEAAAEVDKEERAKQQTETLKLLFVLYFRILKTPRPTPLLPGALEGLSRFAHLVNIDFFGDLLSVLKDLVQRSNEHSAEAAMVSDEDNQPEEQALPDSEHLRHRLLCILTAFELLSGQGEALNIDLKDFINHLYAIILELAISPDIENLPSAVGKNGASPSARSSKVSSKSTADLLFRTLSLVFNTRTSATNSPPWRTAAFAKRLLVSCLSWPPATVCRTIEFVGTLVAKEPRLEALLCTDDRTADGVYRADIHDPQLANAFGSSFWELKMLESNHWDQNVRLEARKLASFVRS
ncbi:hypothetical protein FRC02_007929 [Tulasnella sp. 418]|nr:hypothetical protein FRC02_007929 [Tulasnella sp. 418]